MAVLACLGTPPSWRRMTEDIAQTNSVPPNEGYHLRCNEITVRMKLHEAFDNSTCTYRGCPLVECE